MSDINEQIAKIDGYKWYRCHYYGQSICWRHLRYVPETYHANDEITESKEGPPEGTVETDILYSVPDYLAPENLHELVRICLENNLVAYILASDIGADVTARGTHISVMDPAKINPPVTVEKISAVLAEAIVEAV